jgi:hypothetical protein
MDSHAMHTAEKVQILLRSHIEALRADPFLSRAWLIVIYEKNTGYESGHNWKLVMNYQPAYSIFEKSIEADRAMDTGDQDPGINTTFILKNEYGHSLGTALRKRMIYFYCNWVCSNPWLRPYAKRRAITKQALITQLSNCRVKRPSMDPNRVQLGGTMPRITWSGKIGPDGREVRGQNDDLAMAAAQCMYWINRICQMNYPGFPYDTIFPNKELCKIIKTVH